MTATAYRTGAILAAISANMILISCPGDSGPQPGTPGFFWAAAKQTFAVGDYQKTLDHLDKVVSSENEFASKARPMLLVLTSGMARAYGELADRFEAGGRANKADPAGFRRNMNTYRGQASSLAFRLADVFKDFQKGKDDAVPLAFSFPNGNANPPLVLTRVASGIAPTTGDVETAQKQNIERGVMLAACSAAGAPDDPAKAQEIFKAPEAKVARAVFVTAMATVLFDQSQLFGRTKMDDPEKMKILCTRAQEALKTIPESKETKDLNGKIEKTLKAAKTGKAS